MPKPQPDFVYCECPDCGLDAVLHRTHFEMSGPVMCGPCSHEGLGAVEMVCRPARDDDDPQGEDARDLASAAVH